MNIASVKSKQLDSWVKNQAGNIPVRHMSFDFRTDIPKYFAFGNPVATSLFVVFSSIFPPGERFFVNSVRHFRDEIKDESLKNQVKGFIGQESIHGREHERLNNILEALGYNLEIPRRNIQKALQQLEKLTPEQQLACTVLMEHFTAYLAIQWLTHQGFNDALDVEKMSVWHWHALEELEHKSVSYDVYVAATKDKKMDRFVAFFSVLVVLGPAVVGAWLVIAHQAYKESGKNVPMAIKGVNLLFGKNGFITPLIAKLPEFLRQDFDPSKDDTTQLEVEWRERLFGESGSISQFHTNKLRAM